MRPAAWLCASLLSLGALNAARAQSSHLSDLERAAPAATGDAVATGAAGEWRALWTVPAAAPSLRGVLVGLEEERVRERHDRIGVGATQTGHSLAATIR